MLQAIFYLDRIVHIVKPEKLLYMAIDGVAPRQNKINNAQDVSVGRRCQAAVEARQRGEEVPPDVFDSIALPWHRMDGKG